MVKGVAMLLATLTRGDDEVTMLSMRHASALKASSTFNQLADLAATRNVTQMALLVEDIAKESLSGDGIDEDVRTALAELYTLIKDIKDTLTAEHGNDQKIVDEINDCFKEAKAKLIQEDQQNEALRGIMKRSKQEFNECRKDTLEAYVHKISKCEELDRFIASLAWPKKKEEECIWDGSSKFGEHLKVGLEWYESNYESFLTVRKSCWDAVSAYKNVDTECDRTQTHFEIDTCTHRQAAWTACNDHHSTACKKCSIDFDQTVNDVECREKDRKVDWSSAEKIKCYVDVLTDSPTDEQLKARCNAKGESCLTNWRIFEFKKCEDVCHEVDFELEVDGKKTYQIVDGVNGTHRSEDEADEDRCTRSLDIHFPKKEGCDPCPELPPYPCETEFVEEFYSQFQQNEWVHGIADGTKECAGYMHQEWSAYNLAECRPCPVLIGHDPQHHDAKCQAYGNEIWIETDGGHDTWLNLQDVIVNGGAVDLTASMSRTYANNVPAYGAANCVDGDENTFCAGEVGGWLSVKLKAATCIEHIKVVNRLDCGSTCSRRIVGGHIKILNCGTMVWQDGFKSDQKTYEFTFEGSVEASGLDTANANVINTKSNMLGAGWTWTGCPTTRHGGDSLQKGIWCHSEEEMHLKVPAISGSGKCTATWTNDYENTNNKGFVKLMLNGKELGDAKAHQTKTVTFHYNEGDKLEFWEGFAIAKTGANWLSCETW